MLGLAARWDSDALSTHRGRQEMLRVHEGTDEGAGMGAAVRLSVAGQKDTQTSRTQAVL